MLKHTPSLNSITGDRGSCFFEFWACEEVPREQTARIIEEQKDANSGSV